MSAKVTQVVNEVLVLSSDSSSNVTQVVCEVLIPTITQSPATPTGAGVTKIVAESLFLQDSPDAKVTQVIVEAILVDTSTFGQPGTGPTVQTSYGWAG